MGVVHGSRDDRVGVDVEGRLLESSADSAETTLQTNTLSADLVHSTVSVAALDRVESRNVTAAGGRVTASGRVATTTAVLGTTATVAVLGAAESRSTRAASVAADAGATAVVGASAAVTVLRAAHAATAVGGAATVAVAGEELGRVARVEGNGEGGGGHQDANNGNECGLHCE